MLEVNPERHERLFIYRRRAKLKIRQLCWQFGVSPVQYLKWEAGMVKAIPDLDIGELTEVEKCVVLRRRAGMSQDVLAERTNIPVSGIRGMEWDRIPTEDLIKFWRKYQSDQAN